jgi:hypothetical protein
MRAAPRATLAAALVLGASLFGAPPASASFGFQPESAGFAAAVTEENRMPATQAGAHPWAMRLHLALNASGGSSEGDLRDLSIAMPPGLLADPFALDECSAAQFATHRSSPFEESLSGENCPDSSQVGIATLHTSYGGGQTRSFGVYNLASPYGSPAAIGLAPYGIPIVFVADIHEPGAAMTFSLSRLSQALNLQSIDLTLWGVPWDKSHDGLRGNCLNESEPASSWGKCTTGSGLSPTPQAYLTLPSACEGPLRWEVSADSWQEPGASIEAQAENLNPEGHPIGVSGCVEPKSIAKVQLRTEAAAAATGLLFNIDVNDGGGFLNAAGIVRSPIRKATVSLPEGLTINPSLAAGLGVCGEADLARESAQTPPGAGCPNASKIGDVEVEGLFGLHEGVKGSVYLAKPYQNPFGALIGLYIVIADPARGLFTEALGEAVPDPHTGRLVITFEGLPDIHYTHFTLSLREGQRAALVSPPACATYTTNLALVPWSDPNLIVSDFSIFLITHGEGSSACPTLGSLPFSPGLLAGSLNPQAGAYAPFDLRMTRNDSEQEITSYSATFPPGLLGKIAGVPFCPDAAIEAAKGRSGTEELQAPSCPAASEIGHTLAGYGVGNVLAYAPGALYLAGPYHGAPLSTVAIDSAIVGPFDLGVVVVRSAIRIDRRSAQVRIDSSGSDPIPHILHGIPLHLRDIRVHVDRFDFTLNPTSCNVLGSLSTLTGAGADLFNPADDVPATSSDRYQAFNCSALGFAPKLSIALHGGVGRAKHPALRAVYVPRAGDANIGTAIVALPPTEFLAQGHIRDVCAAALFAAEACPTESIYGHAATTSPLLSGPLEGPVYLVTDPARKLPDMVAALRGEDGIAIDIVGRIDSAHGGMQASFEGLPDAPVSKFVLTLQGGHKGLLENSESLCASPQRANARLIGQDNSLEVLKVRLRADCKGRHKGKRGERR